MLFPSNLRGNAEEEKGEGTGFYMLLLTLGCLLTRDMRLINSDYHYRVVSVKSANICCLLVKQANNPTCFGCMVFLVPSRRIFHLRKEERIRVLGRMGILYIISCTSRLY
ncbi:unnamed protein product [Periconia digitata]|uniref:Uncharacterized protein n=1 Tax=Periconia digitata TaxID=1303443 RepID=A0A9W4XLE2_9PLEO|nr:unnamed protein product [Periconia digitata]